MYNLDLTSMGANGTSPKYDGAYVSGNRPTSTLIASADFTNGNKVPSTIYAGCGWGQFTDGRAGFATVIENGAIKFSYPITNDGGSGLNVSLSPLNTREFYLTFRAKMPNAKNGIKFVKVFGKNATGGTNTVANCTIGCDYTGIPEGKGSIYYISYGDGSTNSNDTQNGIFLNAANSAVIGRSYPGTAVVSRPAGKNFTAADWGTGWHDFRIHVKFNDGTTAQNEVANGIFYLEIDGLVYANATGLFNRHWSNGDIDYVEFAGWTQGNGPAFDLYYDDFKLAIGGWPA